jgi:quinone-reactive Ni/Fe-hydrogenase large subunit
MAKKHLVIDPITRIEGHLRIEAIIDENNVVVDAFSSSTMFRGIEEILKGRDPRDYGSLGREKRCNLYPERGYGY